MPAPSTPVRRSKRLIRWLALGWTFVWTVCTARNAPRNWRSQRFVANGVSDQLSVKPFSVSTALKMSL
ncbi:Hypothetical predicted protein [Cloeon dipterum]|uniref:Uncharacterized protein n=1 Tax=Cloeon dipterum TaxID=197152 RepID=A0A8S1DW09_9INSE|nr:Hypothetical predicted protein [Cloeon dipterum]